MTRYRGIAGILVLCLFVLGASCAYATTLSYTKVVDKTSRVQKKNVYYEKGELIETGTSNVVGSYILTEQYPGDPRKVKKTDSKYVTMVLLLDSAGPQENIILRGWYSYPDKKIFPGVISTSTNKTRLMDAMVEIDDKTKNITLSYSEPEVIPDSCDLTNPYQKLDEAIIAKLKTLTKTDIVKVYVKFIPESQLAGIGRLGGVSRGVFRALDGNYRAFFDFIRTNGFNLNNIVDDYETAFELGQLWIELPVSKLPDFQNRPEVLGITLAP